jgi:hypothetical protein
MLRECNCPGGNYLTDNEIGVGLPGRQSQPCLSDIPDAALEPVLPGWEATGTVFFEGKNGRKIERPANSMAGYETKKYFTFPGFFRGRFFESLPLPPGTSAARREA